MRRRGFISVTALFTVVLIFTFKTLHSSFSEGKYIAESYKLTEQDAINSSNTESLKYLLKYSSETTNLVSPLAYQSSMYSYMGKIDKEDATLFHLFKNGLRDFSTSSRLMKNRTFKSFTAGDTKQEGYLPDINASITEPFVLDEINATINTLTNGVVTKDLVQENLNSFNIISLAIINEDLLADAYTFEDTYMVSGEFKYIYTHDFSLVELPLSNDYTLILAQGVYEKMFSDLGLSYRVENITVRVPKLNIEVFGSPLGSLNSTEYKDILQEYSELQTLYAINHLSINFNSSDKEFSGVYNMDFTKNFIYIIRDDLTNEYVMLGSAL